MDTIELIELAREGDSAAREQVIVNNMPLVWSIVRRFANRGYELEDLFQIGSIGLVKAIDKFDLSFGVKFSTYAVPMIIGEIKRFLRDDGLVKISRSIKENNWKIKQATDKLIQENHREPTIEEIAECTGLTSEEIVIASEATQEVESIYSTIYSGNGDDIYVLDRIADDNGDKANEQILNRILLKQLLSELPEDERNLIELRYYCDKTQTEVAKEMGISQVQVSRLEKRVLLKMRKRAACE